MLKAKLTSSDLADLSGLTRRRIQQLMSEGELPRSVNGKLDARVALQALFKYFLRRVGDAKARLIAARADREMEEAKLAEIKRQRLEGELVPMQEAAELYAKVITPLRGRLLALPPELSAKVNPTEPALAHDALTEWTSATLRYCREKLRE